MSSLFKIASTKFEVEHRGLILRGIEHVKEAGSPPDTRFWREMERRHDLNAQRFDHYHPVIGAVLEGRYPGLITKPVECVDPPTRVIQCPPDSGGAALTAAPEPSSMISLGVGLIAVVLSCKLKRSRG